MSSDKVVHLPEGLRLFPGAGALLGPLDKLVNWGRAGSIWPVTFAMIFSFMVFPPPWQPTV
jgi:NADH:ubiquinone oxidoreductase subunit B-like Fe-S oxidoreductase